MDGPGNTGIMKKMLPQHMRSRETRGHLLTDETGVLSAPIDSHFELRGLPFAIVERYVGDRLGGLCRMSVVTSAAAAEIRTKESLHILNDAFTDDPVMALGQVAFAPHRVAGRAAVMLEYRVD